MVTYRPLCWSKLVFCCPVHNDWNACPKTKTAGRDSHQGNFAQADWNLSPLACPCGYVRELVTTISFVAHLKEPITKHLITTFGCSKMWNFGLLGHTHLLPSCSLKRLHDEGQRSRASLFMLDCSHLDHSTKSSAVYIRYQRIYKNQKQRNFYIHCLIPKGKSNIWSYSLLIVECIECQ